jgi:hypothetical protein
MGWRILLVALGLGALAQWLVLLRMSQHLQQLQAQLAVVTLAVQTVRELLAALDAELRA